MIPVAANDVAFSTHAVLLTLALLFQVAIYEVLFHININCWIEVFTKKYCLDLSLYTSWTAEKDLWHSLKKSQTPHFFIYPSIQHLILYLIYIYFFLSFHQHIISFSFFSSSFQVSNVYTYTWDVHHTISYFNLLIVIDILFILIVQNRVNLCFHHISFYFSCDVKYNFINKSLATNKKYRRKKKTHGVSSIHVWYWL